MAYVITYQTYYLVFFFFFQAEDGIRDVAVTGVQTCALPISHGLAGIVIEHHRRRLKGRATRITIDLDPTDDPTHGQQEFTFFNGHYDTWCYLPVVATVTFNEETEQFAVAAVLRPGNAPAHRGARGLLRRLLRQLRAAFPQARFRVRLDGGFASPPLFTFLEREQVEYLVAMPSNARLEKRARRHRHE